MATKVTLQNLKSVVLSTPNAPKILKDMVNDVDYPTMLEEYGNDEDIKDTLDESIAHMQKLLDREAAAEKKPSSTAIVKATPSARKAKQTKAAKAKAVPKPRKGATASGKAKPSSTAITTRASAQKAKATKRKATKPPVTKKGRSMPKLPASTRIFQRFLALVNKPTLRADYERLLRTLQAQITKREIRASSKYAKLIEELQGSLISIVNEGKSNEKLFIELEPAKQRQLETAANSHKVYPTVALLRRYIRLAGKPVKEAIAKKLLVDMQAAIDSPNTSKKDPYRKPLQLAINNVNLVVRQGGAKPLTLSAQELRGLEGIEIPKLPVKKKPRLKVVNGGLSGLGAIKQDQVVASSDLMRISYQEAMLPVGWQSFLGKVAEGAQLLVYGKPGQGKSTWALSFAKALAEYGNKVLYVSSEQFGGPTLKDLLARLGGGHANLFVTGELPSNFGGYNWVFIDSINRARLDLEDLIKLHAKNPKTSLVLLSQVTKAGDYRGSEELGHEVDTMIEVEDGIASIVKNRFGDKATMSVFKSN